MFGNLSPFFTNWGPASATQGGILTTSAQTKAGVMTFLDGVVFNAMSALGATTATALTETIQGTTDTGTNPLAVRNFRIGASTAVATRPIWQEQINGAGVLSLLPLNSGACAALSWGTSVGGGGAPALTNRGVGTGIILYAGVDASNTDNAIGSASTGAVQWFSVRQANSSYAFRWYGGATLAMSLNGAGLLTLTGPCQLKSYTVATLPASPAAGQIAYASDAAGNGPCIAMGNGSVWKRCDNTATTVA